jgi:UDP-N-acetylmuramoyl-tripeptide--D-alanyl-D-alanine ligase
LAALYTLAELLAATGGTPRGDPGPVSSISIDSRDIEPGALFVAIHGENFDGHDFVAAALAKGAAAALVSADKAEGLSGPLVVVPDALQGLVALARHARARSRAKIAAITGSVGKTTTKEALRAILATAGATHASPKSFNNHWGVPLTLARLPADSAFGVFEIGMNHPGEITALVGMVRPSVSVITAIAPAHLEQLGSLANIARAKAEIFAGLEAGGTAIVNVDHDHAELLVSEARRQDVGRVVTYGYAETADWRIVNYRVDDTGAQAVLTDGRSHHPMQIAAPGRHMISNAAGAVLAAVHLGLDWPAALEGLAGFGAQQGRGARITLGTPGREFVLIDESYNANTASMRAALDVFASVAAPGGRKIVILGDMLELGDAARELHAGLAPAVRASGADRVVLVGKAMAALQDALAGWGEVRHFDDAKALASVLGDTLAYGDAVMVKGSNGVRLTQLVEEIRRLFG